MRELILLRHAHAEPAENGLADIDRPLSPHGLAEAEAAGRWLLEQRLVPDRVLCSPARRTRETLEAVLGLTGYVEQRLEERIYDAENPLGRESVEDHCWVHWYMIVGMVLTAVYGLAAALRRKNHERRLRNDMNDVLGDGDGKDPSGTPAVKPAGMEA